MEVGLFRDILALGSGGKTLLGGTHCVDVVLVITTVFSCGAVAPVLVCGQHAETEEVLVRFQRRWIVGLFISPLAKRS